MDEKFEPEVLREMTVAPLRVPDFSAHVKEKDLTDFDKRDQKMLLTISLMEQKQDFTIAQLVIMNEQVRRQEAEQIRQRRQQNDTNWRLVVVKWVGLTAGAGLLATLFKKAVDVLWP